MFTVNELHELFYAVIYYIDDPYTFRSVALTCSDFSKLCRSYSPAKKKEFSKFMGRVGHVLPNGAVHNPLMNFNTGFFLGHNFHSINVALSQIRLLRDLDPIDRFPIYSKESTDRSVEYHFIYKGVKNYVSINENYYKISLSDHLKGFGMIYREMIATFYRCSFCNKYHSLRLEISPRFLGTSINIIDYSCDCLGKNLDVQTFTGILGVNTNNMNKPEYHEPKQRRLRIARFVVNYANIKGRK